MFFRLLDLVAVEIFMNEKCTVYLKKRYSLSKNLFCYLKASMIKFVIFSCLYLKF